MKDVYKICCTHVFNSTQVVSQMPLTYLKNSILSLSDVQNINIVDSFQNHTLTIVNAGALARWWLNHLIILILSPLPRDQTIKQKFDLFGY